MRSHLLVAVLAMGCGETQLGPFQPLPIDARFTVDGLDDVVHVARDRFGIAHVYAKSARDLGFAQGYVMAHDRLAQMEMLRRFASGTLAEIYGLSDPSVIALDKQMRFHRLRLFAEATWTEIEKRGTFRDIQIADTFDRFADGVNAYVRDINANRWTLDPAIGEPGTELSPLFVPTQFTPWTPIDSVAIMELYSLAQSWTAPDELDLTELDVKLRRVVSPALASDLLAIAPIPAIGATLPAPPVYQPVAATRPPISDALFASARAFFARSLTDDPAQSIGPQSLFRPRLGSTAFVVGPDFTGQQLQSATSILAADMQLALTNPAAFYPMHQIIAGALPEDRDVLDVAGLMLPGLPVALAGTNGKVGWAPTLGTHDQNDIFYEQLTQANGVTYSRHGGIDEPVETRVEEIQIGNHGDISSSELVTYEVVPRHGPVIPNHPAGEALAIAYVGYVMTENLQVLWDLGSRADSMEFATGILQSMLTGPHYMVVDRQGAYAWSSAAAVPTRSPTASAWSAQNPDAAAPFFILDGRNPAHEWTGFVAPQDLPFVSALAPSIVVADQDPTRGTDDGDPINQGYLGIAYANGLRDERIRTLIDRAPLPIDTRRVSEIQHDTRSTMGERIKTELARILRDTPAIATRPAAEQQQIATAQDVLDKWTLATPTGGVAADADSAATLLFNTWMHEFANRAFGDELAAAQYPAPLDDDRVARIVFRLLIAPSAMVQHPTTGEPLLCGAASCTTLAIDAAVQAMKDLTADGSGPDDWRWGRVHAQRLRPLFPDKQQVLSLPRIAEPAQPLAGDMFTIDRSDGGWADLDFTPRIGAAYRMQIASGPFAQLLVMKLELPTGQVLDTRDPHYRDLLMRAPFDVPFTIDDINRRGESRWEFR